MKSGSTISERLGVYNKLIDCVGDSDQWLEYGIIEHRFKLAYPDTYAWMVERWGHAGETAGLKYSASSFLGGALHRLKVRGDISAEVDLHKPTGYWEYLHEVTYAAGVPAPPVNAFLSWHDYAFDNDLDPYEWEFTRPPPE